MVGTSGAVETVQYTVEPAQCTNPDPVAPSPRCICPPIRPTDLDLVEPCQRGESDHSDTLLG